MKTWLLTFLICWPALSQVRSLSPQVFQTHIRPQLVGIDQDIQQIFLAMPHYPAAILRALELVDQLQQQTIRGTNNCPSNISVNCQPQLQAALTILRELDRLWLEQEAKQKSSADASMTAVLGAQRWLQFYQSTERLRAAIEATLLALAAQRKLPMNTWQWRRSSDEIDNWINLLVIEYVPQRLQEDFRSAWMNFFHPLRRQAILHGNSRYLSTNLDSLNFYWNLLNVKLTKRLKKTPDGMLSPLNAIQNRWNQVMRVCLGK